MKDLTEAFADAIKTDMAVCCGVDPDQVECITREVYERETEEDDDGLCGGPQ